MQRSGQFWSFHWQPNFRSTYLGCLAYCLKIENARHLQPGEGPAGAFSLILHFQTSRKFVSSSNPNIQPQSRYQPVCAAPAHVTPDTMHVTRHWSHVPTCCKDFAARPAPVTVAPVARTCNLWKHSLHVRTHIHSSTVYIPADQPPQQSLE